MRLAKVPILVKDQEEARKFYVERLGMELRADDARTMPGFRWLTVAASGEDAVELILLKATAESAAQIGKGPMLVFDTDDCRKAHAEMSARGVKFTQAPAEQPWGWSAVFEDLDGNRYNLAQPKKPQ